MRRNKAVFAFSTLAGLGLLLLSTNNALAQGAKPPTPTTGTGTTTTTTPSPLPTNTNKPSTTDPNSNNSNNAPGMQRPVFLSGRVMMSNGAQLPQGIVIERVCNGRGRPEGYVDTKGYFNIQLGQNNTMLADASVTGGDDFGFGSQRSTSPMGAMGGGSSSASIERQMQGCDLRAVAAGYRSENISLSGRRLLDDPDVGTIILHSLTGAEGYTTSMADMMAPKDAKKAYEKGRELAKKKRFPEAEKEFQKAVDAYPKYASAWYDLGMMREIQGDTYRAREMFEKSIATDPKFIKPYVKIYGYDAHDKKWDLVAVNSNKVIRMNPFEFPDAYFANAVANLNLRKYDDAEASIRQAIKLDTEKKDPKLHHVLGVVLVQKKDYAGGVVAFKSFLERAPADPAAPSIKKQLADLEKYLAATAEPK